MKPSFTKVGMPVASKLGIHMVHRPLGCMWQVQNAKKSLGCKPDKFTIQALTYHTKMMLL